MDTPTHDTMSALRALCHEPPSAGVWAEICAVFDGAPPEVMPVALAYAAEHLDARWPDALRVPPDGWRARALDGEEAPSGWPLVRAYRVVLRGHGPRKILVIKRVRELLGVGLQEAVRLALDTPTVLLALVGQAQAQAAYDALVAAGADVCVEPSHTREGDEGAFCLAAARCAVVVTAWDSARGRKIQAVKALREVSGLGLMEAKEAVDAFEEGRVGAELELEVELARVAAVLETLRGAGFSVGPASTGDADAERALSALLDAPPSASVWAQLCRAVEAVPALARPVAVDRARARLDAAWPDRLRSPPEAWRARMLVGDTPLGWPLVRSYHVVLADVGASQTRTVHALVQLLGVSFEQAQAMVDALPSRVCAWVNADHAERVWRELRVGGADARIEAAWPSGGVVADARFDIELRRVDATQRVRAMFGLRDTLGVTLSDAKAHVERLVQGAAPITVSLSWERDRADAAIGALGAVGCVAQCVPSRDASR